MNFLARPLASLGLLTIFASCLFLFSITSFGQDTVQWKPVTPAELAMSAPIVEPGADAEAIFWEIRMDDKKAGKMTLNHYVRVKIFTERGRERFSKIDIPYAQNTKIESIFARVIKSDGSIVNLQASDIFDREIAKAGKLKVQARSFAVPAIEPGVIVEYQYQESRKNDSAAGERLIFQRDIPLQNVTYYIRPESGWKLTYNFFNMPETRFKDEGKKWEVATLTNVPALKEEPYMPPDDEVKRWVAVRYMTLGTLFQWSTFSIGYQKLLQTEGKPSKEIMAKAAELTAAEGSPETKLRRLYDYVQKNIKNLAYDTSITEEQSEKMNIINAADTFKKGAGRPVSIDLLFAALAKAAGYEVNVIAAGDRSENYFDPQKYPFPGFVSLAGVAVKVGDEWKFFDPCRPFLPFGRLEWNREDVQSLMIGEDGNFWKRTPLSTPKSSPAQRIADLELKPDGSLSGNVTIDYRGLQAISRRHDDYRSSQSKREESFKEYFKKNMSGAEITDLTIENFEDNAKPLIYKFKVNIPAYAQKAGKRMILQPGFFEYGSTPVFTSSTRSYEIFIPFGWTEFDQVKIKLPKGYVIEAADSPGLIEDSQKITHLDIKMAIDRTNNVLFYTRNFMWGNGGFTRFQVDSYPVIKKLFDQFNKADTHAISIKQETTAAAPAQ